MRLRAYKTEDFETVRGWVTDERTHAMWCANLISFPMTREGFEVTLEEAASRFGERAYIAEDDEGTVGFFCISDLNSESRVFMMKFVIVNSSFRGKGVGRQMLALAAKHAFEELGAEAVQLNVFTVNAPAKKCYLAAGFEERRTAENAFAYKDEQWGRCNMVMKREDLK